MDLSGLIFVVLAVGWAAYLIPRALRHHEEIAASRPVDNFSETMRVLERTPAGKPDYKWAKEVAMTAQELAAVADERAVEPGV